MKDNFCPIDSYLISNCKIYLSTFVKLLLKSNPDVKMGVFAF
jgi:hypothetical protein